MQILGRRIGWGSRLSGEVEMQGGGAALSLFPLLAFGDLR